MLIRLKACAALLVSAAFIVSPYLFAQAPIVDASTGSSIETDRVSRSIPARSESQQPTTGQVGQGELFNQLIMLQQEVMLLRGMVEEQAHLLRQVKEQNMERYIDLDRRVGTLASTPAATGGSPSATSTSTVRAGSQPVQVVASEGEKEAYDGAYRLVINKRFDDALEAFKQFLVDFPGGKYAPNSYYWMGELYQVVTPQNLDASREAFSQLLGQYPQHAKAADAMYKLGKVYFLKGNRAKSREWLEKAVADYSNGANSSAADKARQFLNSNF